MTVRTFVQILAWLALAALVTMSLVKPSLRPVLLSHNLEHAIAFAVGGFAAGLAYPERPIRLMVLLVLFAGAIELAQFFAPGRHPTRIDFIVDALSACAGAAMAIVLMRMRARVSERR